MKNIKKLAVLSAVIGAMAALAVPSMASAAVWGPLNTNQSLDASNPTYTAYGGFSWTCTSQHLGTHVRTPASSTLDITSASWTGCSVPVWPTCRITIAPTGLPWTVAVGAYVSPTIHAVMTFVGGGCVWGTGTMNLDGTVGGGWNASTHTMVFTNATGLTLSVGGAPYSPVLLSGSWGNPTQTLTLT